MLALAGMPAFAHKASDSYLQLRAEAGAVELRWDIALRDLDNVVAIDADDDGLITAGEVRAAWPAIDAYALPRFAVDGCVLRPFERGLERRSDGAYAVLWLRADCTLAAEPRLRYSLFRESDATHRGLLKVGRRGVEATEVTVLDPMQEQPQAAAAAPQAASAAPGFVAEGVRHILTGYDHVLFLLCLLLSSVMRRTPHGWQPVRRLRDALLPLLGIVTAFTVAHSITLALAALRIVVVPAWFIEPAVALTIVLAAVDNLWPVLHLPRIAIAFGFGLIHGFAFAGVLGELDLPASSFAWALVQFNLGLELGQLAIVSVAVAALYALRQSSRYPRWVIEGGSLAAIAAGVFWFAERVSDLAL